MSAVKALPGKPSLRTSPQQQLCGRAKMRRGVLIVDFDERVAAFTRTYFRRQGLSTWLAKDAAEALAIYRQQRDRIATVVLDVKTFASSGIDLAAGLKQLDDGLCAYFTSDVWDAELERAAYDAGAQGALVKPFFFKILTDLVDEQMSSPGNLLDDSMLGLFAYASLDKVFKDVVGSCSLPDGDDRRRSFQSEVS